MLASNPYAMTLLALTALASATSSCSHAADVTATWDGTFGVWSDAARWDTNPDIPNNGALAYDVLVSSGTVLADVPGVTVDGLTLSGGLLGGIENVTILVSGSWDSQRIFNTGGVSVASGANFDITGNAAKSLDDTTLLTVDGTATLSGNGVLRSSDSSAAGVAINVNAGGLFDIQSDADIIGEFGASLERLGTLTNGGSFKKSAGSGVSAVDGNWTVNNTGTISVESGTLQFRNFNFGNAFNNQGAVNAVAGTLAFGAGVSTGFFSTAPNATMSIETTASGQHTFDGATIDNAGSFLIDGNTAFNSGTTFVGVGDVTISSGTLEGDAPLSFTDLVWTGGAIKHSAGVAVASGGGALLSGNSPKNLGDSASLAINGAAIVTGTGAINTLADTSLPATLTINAGGSLELQTDADLSDGFGGNNPVATAATLDIHGTLAKTGVSGTTTVEDEWTVNNTGTIDVDSGTVVFEGVFSQGGTVDVAAGAAVAFNGDVTGAGHFPGEGITTFTGAYGPGAGAAEIDFGGHLVLTSDAELVIEIGGVTAGTDFDTLDIVGSATLAGSLAVSLIDSFEPTLGDSFEIVNADGGISGSFAAGDIELPPLSENLTWKLSRINDTLNLVVALLGDFNQNDVVDQSDYVVWRDSLGATGTGLPADADGNGTVDAGDLQAWRRNYGAAAHTNAVTVAIKTPEPRSLLLLLSATAFPIRGYR